MPSLTKSIEVRLSEAELLADLFGIQYDLDAAYELCEAATTIKEAQINLVVLEGLVSAAVVKYARCFANGVRHWLNVSDIEDADTNMVEHHEYFIDLRNKYVSHSVNPFEETFVTASACERDGVKQPITSLNPGQHRVLLTHDVADHLKSLIVFVQGVVKNKINDEKAVLLKKIQKIPLYEFYKGDLYTPPKLTTEHVRKSRRKTGRYNKSVNSQP